MKFKIAAIFIAILNYIVQNTDAHPTTVLNCDVVIDHYTNNSYLLEPVRCPDYNQFKLTEFQIVKVSSNNVLFTQHEVKPGTLVLITYEENQIQRLKRGGIFQDLSNRGINGPKDLIFTAFLYLLSPSNPYSKVNDDVQNEKKKEENQFESHLPPVNKNPFGPFYYPPARSVPPKRSSTTTSQNSNTKKQCSASKSDNVSRYYLVNGQWIIQTPSGNPPPPTPPPNGSKKIPDDKYVVDEDDDDDEDELRIISLGDEDEEVEVISEEISTNIVMQDDNDDVQILNENEIYISVREGDVMTSIECQPSTSSGFSAAVLPGESRPSSRAGSMITIGSSSSEASIGLPPIRVALPAVRPNAGFVTGIQIVRRAIPESQQWMGLHWGTEASGITNTCNFDSFLSHVIFMARSRPDYFLRNLNLVNSIFERSIATIADSARAQQRRTLPAVFSKATHQLWLDTLTDRRLRNPKKFVKSQQKVVNMVGTSDENVFIPLRDSSLVWFLHACHCLSDSADEMDQLTSWSAENLNRLNTNSYNSKKSSKKCKRCKNTFNSNQSPAVSTATWFHSFRIPESVPSSSYTDYPLTLNFIDIQTREPVIFDLGFFGLSTRFRMDNNQRPIVGHATSIHRIGNTFQYYNGMQNNGYLQPIPNNLVANLDLDFVVYFRR